MNSNLSAETRKATYQDVIDAPAHRVAEIVDARLYVSPRPVPLAAFVKTGLSVEIGLPFGRGRGGPGGWRILNEPELHFGDDVLVPDVAGWRRERVPTIPTDYIDKRPVYAREGVSHLWLIDRRDRTLEAFELREGEWVLIACAKDDEPVSVRPFDAVTFSLGDLWS